MYYWQLGDIQTVSMVACVLNVLQGTEPSANGGKPKPVRSFHGISGTYTARNSEEI